MKRFLDNSFVKYGIIAMMIIAFFALETHEYGFNWIVLSISLIAMIINFLYVFYNKIFERMIDGFVKYRFLIFTILFIICVLFKIHGSSIGNYIWNIQNNSVKDESVLFGTPRPIRSDEWAILTPYYFSQNSNNYEIVSYQMSLEGQNMIIGFNAPVKDITILGKPLVWGYMLFGNEYGLSWYWCMKVILIFLSSFEMFYILTKNNKKLSILGAILVTYGPSTQWWLCPHMPDVILWGMVLFSFVYHFTTNKSENIRNVLTILIPFVVMQYCIALFPSFQVGLGIFFLGLFAVLVYRDKIKIFENKRQIIRLIIVVILSIFLVGYFVVTCKEALKLESNTVYPGRRVALGGTDYVKDLFTDLSTPFLPYTNGRVPYANECEASTYIHFGMFVLMLMPILIQALKKNKERDAILGIYFSIIVFIYGFFMIVGFPEWLAKITFFSYINRMKMILGFIMVIFTIWFLNTMNNINYKVEKNYYYLAVFAYSLMLLSFVDYSLKFYLPFYLYYVEIILYASILLLIVHKRTDYAYSLLIAVVLFSSISINPIVKGISSIEKIESSSKIKQIVDEDPDSYWFANGNSVTYSSFLLLNGAKTINGINFYPDYKKWKMLDPEGEFESKYNRYGYIVANISGDKQNVIDSYVSPDVITLTISLDKLYMWNVKYIYSKEDISSISYDGYYLEEIYSDSDMKIYELIKK